MKIKFIKEYRATTFSRDGTFVTSTFKEGHSIDLNKVQADEAQWLIDNGFAEKVEDTKGGWKPEIDDTYYCVLYNRSMFTCDIVGRQPWLNDELDEYRYSIGNVFKTMESARRFIDYLKAVETVRHDEGFMKYDKIQGEVWELRKAYLDDDRLFSACKIEYDGFHHLGAFYFDTEEHAIASSDKHPNKWQTILNYDWSKGE